MDEFRGTIREIKKLSENVEHFEIELNKEINFEAGQFIMIEFDLNQKILKRAYSIASPPNYKNNKFIQLCIKKVEGGEVSPRIFKEHEEDVLKILGPAGNFRCLAEKDNLYFIANGTGIAPLRSMILDLLYNKKVEKTITLIYGARYESNLLYKEEFEELEKNYPNFRYIKVLSRPDDNWDGRRGHVQDNFDVIKDVINSEFYFCGLPQMFEESKKKLMDMGVPEENIHKEVY
jgi:NAD(P)H-flavin reductase